MSSSGPQELESPRPVQPRPGPVHGTSPGASQLPGTSATGLPNVPTGREQLGVGREKQRASILQTDLPIRGSERAFGFNFESHMDSGWKCTEKEGLDYKQGKS